MSQECADEIEKDFLCESLPPEFSHSLHPIEPLRLLPGDYRTGAKTGTRWSPTWASAQHRKQTCVT